MGWRDRPYARFDYDAPPPRGAGVVFGGMPRPGRAVKSLLIANLGVFVLQIFPPVNALLMRWMTVVPAAWWQVWRYLTFQFLHAGLFHILFNMLGLYFLGMLLETGWGARRFVYFYLGCGAAAGVAHVLLAYALGRGYTTMLLGASGGVYAVVLACAVLYPQVRLIVFLFPLPIRVAAALFLGIACYYTLMEIASGGAFTRGVSDIAHLGGAAAAAFYIWVLPRMGLHLRAGGRLGRGRWERNLRRQRREAEQIDRILEKIRREGIRSLSWREKRILRKATQRRREEP